MASPARREFVESIVALKTACDDSSVRAQDATGRFLRKGLVVAAFNTLEGFVSARWSELANHANLGHTQFQDLPEAMQKRALERTLSVAAGEVRRGTFTLGETKAFLGAVGSSLRTVSGRLELSGLAGKWDGSNMGADDLTATLRTFHVETPWSSILELTSLFGYPSVDGTGAPMNLASEFRQLTRTRNEAAHEMGFNITSIQLRTIPPFINRVAFGYDVLASAAIDRLHRGDLDYLSDDKNVKVNGLAYFTVMDRGKDHAVYHPPVARARKVGKDGDALFNQTCTATSPDQFVVRTSVSGDVVDWMIHGAG